MRILRLNQSWTVISAACGKFISWWFTELAWFVPERWRRREPPRIEIHEEAEQFRVVLIRRQRILREGCLRDGRIEPTDLWEEVLGDSKRAVWVFPSSERILRRIVEVPASALSRFKELLNFEIDRWSPYSLNEIYAAWDALPGSASPRKVDLRLVPRSDVETILDELRRARLAPSCLCLSSTVRFQIDLRAATMRRRPRAIAWAFVCALLFVTFLVADWTAASRELEVWGQRYRAEVKLLATQRSLEERITAAISTIERSGSNGSTGKLLAGVSRALPDTDWLTEVATRKDKTTLRGYAENVGRLVKRFEPLAIDKIVNMQGETGLDPSTRQQRFAVTFRPIGD